MNSYNYSEIIIIQLTGFLNLKPVNWNFAKNWLTIRLSGFGSQPYKTLILVSNSFPVNLVSYVLLISLVSLVS